MKKKIISTVVIVVAVFVAYYYFNSEEVNVSLKWRHQAQFAGFYTAKERGYYSRNGLDVSLNEFSSDVDEAQGLKDGTFDFVMLSPEEFIKYIHDGEDFVAVASFFQSSPLSLVSLEESKITSPSDFIGKVLGNKGGGLQEDLIYRLLLAKFGIPDDEVEIKKLGFGKTELNNLLDGDADIMAIYRIDQMYFFEKEEVGYNIIYPENFGINVNNDILVTTKDMVENNPKVVKKFISSTVKGWEFALRNRERAIDYTMKYIEDPNYNDRDYQNYILNNSANLIESFGVNIGYIDKNKIETLHSFMQENGFIDPDIEISDHYTNVFVE